MERVVETALAIVDRDGLAHLSMRKLGAELGVDPMAVYHYIPNKAALLDGLTEAVMNELGIAPPRESGDDVTEWFVYSFHSFWEVLRAHPNVLPVMATRPITGDSGLRSAERVLEELHGIGLPADDAMAAMMALTTLTVSMAQAEAGRNPENMDPSILAKVEDCYRALPPAEFPLLLEGLTQPPAKDWGRVFDLSIRMFVAGLIWTYAPGKQEPAALARAITAG
jgi:AcrR family transcriptional regulator